MTKEDIINSYNCHVIQTDDDTQEDMWDMDDIMSAMSEWAKIFAEWINKNGWTEYDTYDRWTCPSQGREVIDTEELYKRFEEDQNKK